MVSKVEGMSRSCLFDLSSHFFSKKSIKQDKKNSKLTINIINFKRELINSTFFLYCLERFTA